MNVSSFNLSRKNKQFKKEYQNRMKNDRFMPIRRSHAKVAVGLFWAESWQFWSHFIRYFWPKWAQEFSPRTAAKIIMEKF